VLGALVLPRPRVLVLVEEAEAHPRLWSHEPASERSAEQYGCE
jgi:hypothetical protein